MGLQGLHSGMNTEFTSGAVESAPVSREAPRFPEYGPVDASLGFALFYVLVVRATPTVVEVLTDVLSVSPSFVGTGLAALLWFVLAVTVLDQARRQLAALGVGSYEGGWPNRPKSGVPSRELALAYLGGLVVGGLLAWWTFAPAVETAVALIRVVAARDVGAFDLLAFLVMVVFFVSYAVATRSLDRLVVGGIRAALAG